LLICYVMYNILCLKVTKSQKKSGKKLEQDEMKEEDHQLELKEGYEQDEKFEESKD